MWDNRVKIIVRNLKKLIDYSEMNNEKLDEILEHLKATESAQPNVLHNKLNSECSRFIYRELKSRAIS